MWAAAVYTCTCTNYVKMHVLKGGRYVNPLQTLGPVHAYEKILDERTVLRVEYI